MSNLRNWFGILGRIHQEERERWELMQRIFSERKFNAEALQIPACWRRKGKLGG